MGEGASGYLLVHSDAEAIFSALQHAATGRTVLDATIGGRIAAHLAQGRWRATPDLADWDLRPRERDVLEELITGSSNREIAERLHLSEETVKTYLRALYRKLGARGRVQAVTIALRGT